jgi:hypothetical protein
MSDTDIGILTVFTLSGKVKITCTLKVARSKADGNGWWESNGQKIFL